MCSAVLENIGETHESKSDNRAGLLSSVRGSAVLQRFGYESSRSASTEVLQALRAALVSEQVHGCGRLNGLRVCAASSTGGITAESITDSIEESEL